MKQTNSFFIDMKVQISPTNSYEKRYFNAKKRYDETLNNIEMKKKKKRMNPSFLATCHYCLIVSLFLESCEKTVSVATHLKSDHRLKILFKKFLILVLDKF